MLLGVSTMQGFNIIDVDSLAIAKKYNDNCYGFTFDDNNYFLKTSQEPTKRRSILVFDKQYSVIKKIAEGEPKIVCGHQMQYHKPTNQLWMPCPGSQLSNNDIFIYSLDDGNYQIWKPTKEKRRLHYNSICFNGSLVHIMAHNYHVVPSFVYTYEWKTRQLVDKVGLAYGDCHNVFYIDDDLYYCASKESKIMNANGDLFIDTKPDGGIFLRGIALNDQYLFVGSSPFSPRERKKTNGGKILIYNVHSGEFISSLEIPNTGAIHEIRILDSADYAHTTEEG